MYLDIYVYSSGVMHISTSPTPYSLTITVAISTNTRNRLNVSATNRCESVQAGSCVLLLLLWEGAREPGFIQEKKSCSVQEIVRQENDLNAHIRLYTNMFTNLLCIPPMSAMPDSLQGRRRLVH